MSHTISQYLSYTHGHLEGYTANSNVCIFVIYRMLLWMFMMPSLLHLQNAACMQFAYLHVSDGLYLSLALGLLLVVVHQCLDVYTNLTKVQVHVLQQELQMEPLLECVNVVRLVYNSGHCKAATFWYYTCNNLVQAPSENTPPYITLSLSLSLSTPHSLSLLQPLNFVPWVTVMDRFHYTSTFTCTLFNLSSMLCTYMKLAICLQSNQLWCSLIDRDLPLYRTRHVQGKEPLPGGQEQWHHNDITSIYSASCTNNGATYTYTLYMCTHPFKNTHTHTHTYIIHHLIHPS